MGYFGYDSIGSYARSEAEKSLSPIGDGLNHAKDLANSAIVGLYTGTLTYGYYAGKSYTGGKLGGSSYDMLAFDKLDQYAKAHDKRYGEMRDIYDKIAADDILISDIKTYLREKEWQMIRGSQLTFKD